MNEPAKDIIGMQQTKKLITKEILECNAWRGLKNIRYTTGTEKYREVNKKIRIKLRKAKEEWVRHQCSEVENLKKNKSKKTFQIVKDLSKQKQSRINNYTRQKGKFSYKVLS